MDSGLRRLDEMVCWRGLAALLLGCGLCGVAAGQRLPGGVRPEHYSLTIAPDLKAATFRGAETIDVVVEKTTDAITLNAAEIEFAAVKAYVVPSGRVVRVVDKKGRARPVDLAAIDTAPRTAEVTLDAAKEQATLRFARELPAGRVVLEIQYRGILNEKLRGFYLSKTKTRSYAVTQFEATDARRAFPSFDEPALKATFDVTLVVDSVDTAISNTKMVSDTPGPVAGKHTVAFAYTPMMSTYLVAFLVGDFVCTEGKSDGVPIRVCSTPDKVGLTRTALDTAKWTLHYYDKYFGIKYPMAKLDMVAIPDFEAGAMENFGCITYRETEMLVDSKDGAVRAKKEIAETVTHEMAHQWFGDLVTPVWWDNLWLNEGFATWMEAKAAAKFRAKWKFDQDQAVDLNRTMDEDAARTTRAIRTRAETPAEINEMFDGIAYGKAGAVIGMLENWVGEEVFRRGVHEYLAQHLYGNATAEDFWGAQTRVSGLPVDKVMSSFVDQPGVPLLTFSDVLSGGVSVDQDSLLFRPKDSCGQSGGGPLACTDSENTEAPVAHGALRSWAVPICIKGGRCELLSYDSRGSGATLGVPSYPFFYANAGDKGYYRTKYTAAQFQAMVADAEAGLTPPERIGLLGDRWALMRAGQGTVGDFLDLVLAVKLDPNETVLESSLGKVGTIDSMIATEEDRERLDAVVLREFGPVYGALGAGSKHRSYDRAELRGTLFEALGKAGDPTVLAEAQSVTRDLFSGQKPADPAIADAAVALATAKGDTEMYDKLVQVGQSATDPDLKEDALHTLTRFQSPPLVGRTLEYAVSDQVRSQDSWTLIALLLSRRETQDQAWEFVQQHWDSIARKSTENSGPRIVEAAGAFCTVEKRDEVASFFRAHTVESSERTLAKSIDSINDCIRLRAAEEPNLRQWLGEHAGQ